MLKHHFSSIETVLQATGSTMQGLSASEAADRLAQNGKNKLAEPKKPSVLRQLLEQLRDPMTLILLGAAAISTILELLHGGVPYDTFIILFVVAANAVLGVLQERKAEAAIAALQTMAAGTSKVFRDGQLTSVPSETLVLGDVIALEAGDAVPADCRIMECASMQAEEAALTGESAPVTKTVEPLSGEGEIPLGDRSNMAYTGSTIVYGRGKAVVTATGMDTEMGKIADAILEAKAGRTPLQQKLDQLSHILTKLVIGICLFIFAFNLIRVLLDGGPLRMDSVLSFFMVAVSLAVAAIPEGLVAVVTIVLSAGVTKMSKQNAIIRKLTAVETLGCAQIICSDKTGTLTQNKMTVTAYYGDDELALAKAMALCTDAVLGSDGSVTGEPTEAALVSYAASLQLNKTELEDAFPRVDEAPFDSTRKRMSTIHRTPEGFVQYTKGAPDEILNRCTHCLEGGQISELTPARRDAILQENKRMADKALRVLACAMRTYEEKPPSNAPEELEQAMVFLGLTGMIDPIRPEVQSAIAQCRSAGITPVMITGDHLDTAIAIARQLGILDDPSQAMTGAQLSELDEETFLARVQHTFVYARVQPEHKTRIVKAWQSLGYVTAMTGDGVNDAPSIKSADIGIGMGITGTDVTKNVADMILADDNFATIVQAVGEGRRIYDNIRKAIQFLLGSNLSEVLTVFAASILGLTVLRPTHLLFINLVTDCFPALALGIEHGEPDRMRRPPRKTTDGVFSGGLGIDILYQGILVSALTFAAYFVGRATDPNCAAGQSSLGVTMAFFTMSMCEIFHAFNMRSQRQSMFRLGHWNLPLVGAAAASLLLTTAIIEIRPLATVFQFAENGLDLPHYFISIGLAILVIPIVELVKLLQRAAQRRRKN